MITDDRIVVDTRARTITYTHAERDNLSAGPHGLRPSPDGSAVVVANTTAGAIDVVDTATNAVAASIPVGDSPPQVAVSADGRYVYVTLIGSSSVVKVDLAEQQVIGSVAVPAPPVQLYLTADGTRLLSADQGTDDTPGTTVTMIDPESMTVESTVQAGSGPHGVVIEPTGQRAWVTNLYDDTVSVIGSNWCSPKVSWRKAAPLG